MLTSPPSLLRSRGLRRGLRTRGRPRPNAFREAVDFSQGGGWGEAASLLGSARSAALEPSPYPEQRDNEGRPPLCQCLRWQVLGSSRLPGYC